MNQDFWSGKRVLVTGHTGFKGSWLCILLHELGATVIGYALEPKNPEDNFVRSQVADIITDLRGDIRDRDALNQVFKEYQPEVVFHLAAQPLVLESYENPYETYEINVMGTLNVLEAIRYAKSVRTGILITTDKCYENKEDKVSPPHNGSVEKLGGFRENDPFGGYDPYSASKACDEILIASYRNSYFPITEYEKHQKAIASVRAGNVIGGGDWSKDRILPDCIRAIEARVPIRIRNRYAIRPWQHVLEPLAGYLELAEALSQKPCKYSGGWNFGPDSDSVWTVWDVAEEVVKSYGKGSLEDGTIPSAVHEAGKLVLNIDKAKQQLQWFPRLSVEQAIAWTVEWYKDRNDESTCDICRNQINKYIRLMEG